MPTNAQYDLTGQVALVTGAARGIGRACAVALAAAGADIALGLLDVDRDDGAADEIRALGRVAMPLQMDVADTKQISDAFDAVQAGFGRLDILVNNAGVSIPAAAEEVTEEQFDRMIALNLKGTFFASQAAARVMLKQGYGRIVSLSSQAGFVALPTESIYCITKAAIAHMTKCLAVEWGGSGITVNAVAPTFIKTPGTINWLSSPTFEADVISRIPVGHVGEPENVASAVLYLATPAARMVNGATLLIDGGWTAQ